MTNSVKIVSLGVSFCAILSTEAAAAGFALEHQSARALGMAFAGAQAIDDDPGMAAYNPAALAGADGVEISLTATGVFPLTEYDSAQATLLGVAPVAGASSGTGISSNEIIPNLTIAVPLGARVTAGVTVNGAFGFKTSYEADIVVRYQARDSDLQVIEFAPTLAYEPAPGVTVGASLRAHLLDLTVTSTIDAGGIAAANLVPGFAPGSSDMDAAFEGDNWALGYAVGVQAALTPRARFGASYTSKIEHDIEGDAAFDLAGSAAGQVLNAAVGLFAADRFTSEFVTPGAAGVGFALDATDRLTLLASGRVTFWSSFEDVTLSFDDLATPDEILRQEWKDAWSVSLGAEYELTPQTTVRGGVMYDETPVTDQFASPRIPDGDRYWISAGLSHQMSSRVSADIGVAYAAFGDRDINLTGAAPEELFRGGLSGRFSFEAVAVSGRLRVAF